MPDREDTQMSDSTRYVEGGDDANERPISGTPRWVKTSLIVALVLVVLIVVMLLVGGFGHHGPGRH